MQQVAAEAGVSVSTVSKVINGRYGVSTETFDHVTEVINRLGYEASLVARSLRNTRTNVIGVLVADFEPFSTEVLKGAADAIRGTGYELVAYSAGGRVDEHVGWERRYLSRVMGTLVDGAVLVTPTVTDVQYDGPIVAVDPHTGRSSLPTVDGRQPAGRPDGRRPPARASATAGSAWSPVAPDLVSAQLRERGYREAHASGRRPRSTSRCCARCLRPRAGPRRCARRCCRLPEPPTAIFAANDISALATLEVAAELGVDVPAPALGGRLRQHPRVGAGPPAADHRPATDAPDGPRRRSTMLVALIAGEALEDTHVTLETTLVRRRSTAAPEAT